MTRTFMLRIRLTPAEQEQLATLAQAANLGMSAYVRQQLGLDRAQASKPSPSSAPAPKAAPVRTPVAAQVAPRKLYCRECRVRVPKPNCPACAQL